MTCKWNGRGNPRIVTGRHDIAGECRDETCTGCMPCREPHCRICGVIHTTSACPECMAETREALHEIAKMCGALPEEVENRGVDGEAMFLLGPVADPEARGHLEASVRAGRVDRDVLEARHVRGCGDPLCTGCDIELHPELVCLSWQMVWRDALDHDEAPNSKLWTAIDYLDQNMTYMASYPHVPFEEFAMDLRLCRSQMVRVLHDEPYGDRANVGCFDCKGGLERRLTTAGFEDFWTCRGCRRQYTYAEYNFALRAELEEQSKQEEPA